jgi:signal transduction histidine kinase
VGAGPVGLRHSAVGWVLAGAVLLAGAGSALVLQHRLDASHAKAVTAAERTLAQTVAVRRDRLTARVSQYAQELQRLPLSDPAQLVGSAPHTDFTAVGVAGSSLPLQVVSGSGLPRGIDAPTDADLQNAAISARDTAQPLAVIAPVGGSAEVFVVWPLYRGTTPIDTQTRRTTSAGWVVGSTSAAAVFGPAAAAERGLGVTVALDATRSGPAPVGETLRSGINGRVTSVPQPSRLGVLLLGLLTAIAACALAAVAAVGARRESRAEARRLARDDQLSLVTEVSVTIQESLDIGVVIPAVLAQITDRLGLTWIRVVTGTTAGGIELLALGRRPARIPAPRSSPEATIATAGQLVRFPLRRLSRTLGHLELISRADLDEDQLASLGQCAEMLAAALHNAELYEREQESVRRLRELDVLKDDFLGTVSHELRTPLAVLVGYVSLLTKSWDRLPDESRRSAVEMMQPNVLSLTHLVNDLLDFISDRRAATSASLGAVGLDERVHGLVDQLRPLVHRQDLQFVGPDPVEAWTDPQALERIIGNLVGNAGKYSPEGTSIRVEVRQGVNDAIVSVTDEGPGIRPEDQDRIFERFYRGDSQAARSSRGTGIGLAVTLSWVGAVGGRLEVRTAVDRGTTMTVRLPRTEGVVIDGAGTVTWQRIDAPEEELV